MAIRPANSTSQEVFITDVAGINVAAPPQINVASIPCVIQRQCPYVSASGAPAPSGTTAAISLGKVQGSTGAAVIDITGVTIAIANNTNTNIISGNLAFTETVGGQTVTITYNLNITAITSGGGVFVQKLPLPEGHLMNATLNLTWTSAPSSNTASVQAVFHTS
jgi:hypothetical protein